MNLKEAKSQINQILCQLEVATGSVVESIDLRDIDVTTVDGGGVELTRSVQIELKRLPGTKWC